MQSSDRLAPLTEVETDAQAARTELLDLLLEASPDGVMDIDFVRGETNYSDRWKLLLGYETADLASSASLWRDLSHPDDLPQVDALLRDHLEDHWPFNHTWRMRHQSGEWRWMMCRTVTARSPTGLATRMVALFCDISERIKTEENQRALVSAIPDLLLRLRSDGTIVHVKAPDQGSEGIPLPQAGDRLSNWPLAQDWHERIVSCMRDWREKGRHRATFEVTLGDGSPRRHAEVRLVPGALDEAVCIVRDVSEQRNIHALLLQASKLESVGQLAPGIAHEINTPMQGIGDNLFFLQKAVPTLLHLVKDHQNATATAVAQRTNDGSKGSERELKTDLEDIAERAPKAITAAREGVARVAKIVSALEEFFHPGGKEKTLTALNQVLETTLTIATNVWKDVAKVETFFDPKLPLVRCHPSEINQVFLNLIVNAAHAVGEVAAITGKPGLIKITTRAYVGFVDVRIADTGSGIPEKVQDRIFDLLFSTKEGGRGTGQGLALARSTVVDGHGGTIHFETEVGRGTTFVVRLPSA